MGVRFGFQWGVRVDSISVQLRTPCRLLKSRFSRTLTMPMPSSSVAARTPERPAPPCRAHSRPFTTCHARGRRGDPAADSPKVSRRRGQQSSTTCEARPNRASSARLPHRASPAQLLAPAAQLRLPVPPSLRSQAAAPLPSSATGGTELLTFLTKGPEQCSAPEQQCSAPEQQC